MARWNSKPPAGTQIDRSHSLGSVAGAYYLCNQGVLLQDIAGTNLLLPSDSTITQSAGPVGVCADNSGGGYWSRSNVAHSSLFASSGNTLWWWGVPSTYSTYGFFFGFRIGNNNSYAIGVDSGAVSVQWRDFYGWASGLSITANADTFIVLSVRHQAATLHVWTNGVYTSASTTDGRMGVVDPNAGTVTVGCDPYSPAGRYVRGRTYGCGSFKTAFTPEQAKAFRANPFDLFAPPISRRSWFLPATQPPAAFEPLPTRRGQRPRSLNRASPLARDLMVWHKCLPGSSGSSATNQTGLWFPNARPTNAAASAQLLGPAPPGGWGSWNGDTTDRGANLAATTASGNPSSITTIAWLRIRNGGTTSVTCVKRSNNGYTGPNLVWSASQWYYYVSTSGGSWQASLGTGAICPAGQWYRIAGSYNHVTGDVRIYVNGRLVNSTTITPGVPAWQSTAPWHVVGDPGNQRMYGYQDDTCIYSRELTPDEILADYLDASSGRPSLLGQPPWRIPAVQTPRSLVPPREGWTSKPPPGVALNQGHPLRHKLVGAWLFNEGAGALTGNLADTNRPGTLVGADWMQNGVRTIGSGQYVNCGSHERMDPGVGGDYTILIGCRPSGSFVDYRNLVFKGTSNANVGILILSDGTWRAQFDGSDVVGGTLVADKDYVLGISYRGSDGGKVTLLHHEVGGESKITQSTGKTIRAHPTAPLTIGGDSYNSRWWSGYVQWGYYWVGRSLNAADMQQVARRPYSLLRPRWGITTVSQPPSQAGEVGGTSIAQWIDVLRLQPSGWAAWAEGSRLQSAAVNAWADIARVQPSGPAAWVDSVRLQPSDWAVWADGVRLQSADASAWADAVGVGGFPDVRWHEAARLGLLNAIAWPLRVPVAALADVALWRAAVALAAWGQSAWSTSQRSYDSAILGDVPVGLVPPQRAVRRDHHDNRGLLGWWVGLRNWCGGRQWFSAVSGAPAGDLSVQSGTLAALPTWSQGPGTVGLGAVRIVGNGDSVRIPHRPRWNVSQITVSCWFRLTSALTDNDYRMLVMRAAGTTWVAPFGPWGLRIECSGLTDHRPRLAAWVNNASIASNWASGARDIGAGEWYQATLTYDGTRLRIYVNGQLDGESVIGSALSSSSFGLSVGSNTIGGDGLRGHVADIKVYGRELTTTEVAAAYREGMSGYPRALHWHRWRLTQAPLLASAAQLSGWSALWPVTHSRPGVWDVRGLTQARSPSLWPLGGLVSPHVPTLWEDWIAAGDSRTVHGWSALVRALSSGLTGWNLRGCADAALLSPWHDFSSVDWRAMVMWHKWIRQLGSDGTQWSLAAAAGSASLSQWLMRTWGAADLTALWQVHQPILLVYPFEAALRQDVLTSGAIRRRVAVTLPLRLKVGAELAMVPQESHASS